MVRAVRLTTLMLSGFILLALLVGCSETSSGKNTVEIPSESKTESTKAGEDNGMVASGRIPQQLARIPEEYEKPSKIAGRLEALDYTTFEAFSYEEQSAELDKTAYVYLPAGYDESRQYNIFYLMHGGWSNETTLLGTPENPTWFKNVLDHAIADGKIPPLIIVCPTYNNTSASDSGDYGLALQLTNLYHQELLNDLIPAVESKYSTYAEDTTPDGIRSSRDHRGFGGFSMGSVTTWRTFQHCLDSFRYFLPMSGNVGMNGELMADVVRDSGYDWDDFFIYAISGTDDFAYSAFRSMVESMLAVKDGTFRSADNEQNGNLAFREQVGGIHDYNYANQYTYNGLLWLWNHGDKTESETEAFTLDSKVGDVINHPVFGDFGHLLFPVHRPVSGDMTLTDVSSDSVYVWYSNIHPEKTVEIVNQLKTRAEAGKSVFFNIYSEADRATDASKNNTGLFYFGGEPGERFAIVNAGGGFSYVGAMHDSFPHALELSKMGYHGFALIYRPDKPYEDLAKAISYIYDHADDLNINPDGYSLWGGSAGARMAAVLGNEDNLSKLTGRTDIMQAAAVIMQYTGYSNVSSSDAPTYACVGTNDGIANWRTMENRLKQLEALGIPTEFHVFEGLSHGFGIGTNTNAESWMIDAVAFWEVNID